MAQSSSVPQFGARESGESTPNYTTLFNQAREDRVTGKKINPNEPQQNQQVFPNTTGTSVEPESVRKGVDNTGRRAAGDQSPHHRHGARGGGSGGRHVRQNNAESQHSSDRSPRHPSKTKSSNRGDETPDGGTVVPKFGEWDETKPETGDNFTGIFKRLQEEKHNALGGKSPGHVITPSSSYPTKRNLSTDDSAKCPCFPWCRK